LETAMERVREREKERERENYGTGKWLEDV
jgi:muconolactone delta-isomerase